VLDWALTAACLQVSADPRAGTLDEALAAHFGYLLEQAPLTHAVIVALLRVPGTRGPTPTPCDNEDLIRLAGGAW
jgi:hypothetical protein